MGRERQGRHRGGVADHALETSYYLFSFSYMFLSVWWQVKFNFIGRKGIGTVAVLNLCSLLVLVLLSLIMRKLCALLPRIQTLLVQNVQSHLVVMSPYMFIFDQASIVIYFQE